MAFDTKLADRIRRSLGKEPGITEKQQFGGVAYLVNGNVACGVIANDMLVRVGPEKHEQAMANTHAKAFSLTGRPSKGWVIVSRDGLKTAAELNRWVRLGTDFAASLPPK